MPWEQEVTERVAQRERLVEEQVLPGREEGAAEREEGLIEEQVQLSEREAGLKEGLMEEQIQPEWETGVVQHERLGTALDRGLEQMV